MYEFWRTCAGYDQAGPGERQLRELRRERAKENKQKQLKEGGSYNEMDITLEEYEQINQQLKERELAEEQYFYRTRWMIIGIGVVGLVVGGLLIRLFLF